MANRAALCIGGPYHLKKLMLPDSHDRFRMARIPRMESAILSDTEGTETLPVVEMTYSVRNWLGSEVWVLTSMSDSTAMDMLLTSVFQSHKGH